MRLSVFKIEIFALVVITLLTFLLSISNIDRFYQVNAVLAFKLRGISIKYVIYFFSIILFLFPTLFTRLLKAITLNKLQVEDIRLVPEKTSTALKALMRIQIATLLLLILPLLFLIFNFGIVKKPFSYYGRLESLRNRSHVIALYEPTDTLFSLWKTHPRDSSLHLRYGSSPFPNLVLITRILGSSPDSVSARIGELEQLRRTDPGLNIPRECLPSKFTSRPEDREDIAVAASLVARLLAMNSSEGYVSANLKYAREFMQYAASYDSNLAVPVLGLGVCQLNNMKALLVEHYDASYVPDSCLSLAKYARSNFYRALRLPQTKELHCRILNDILDLNMHLAYLLSIKHKSFNRGLLLDTELAWADSLRNYDLSDYFVSQSNAIVASYSHDERLLVTQAQTYYYKASYRLAHPGRIDYDSEIVPLVAKGNAILLSLKDRSLRRQLKVLIHNEQYRKLLFFEVYSDSRLYAKYYNRIYAML